MPCRPLIVWNCIPRTGHWCDLLIIDDGGEILEGDCICVCVYSFFAFKIKNT